jgi:hypothetical protein
MGEPVITYGILIFWKVEELDLVSRWGVFGASAGCIHYQPAPPYTADEPLAS